MHSLRERLPISAPGAGRPDVVLLVGRHVTSARGAVPRAGRTRPEHVSSSARAFSRRSWLFTETTQHEKEQAAGGFSVGGCRRKRAHQAIQTTDLLEKALALLGSVLLVLFGQLAEQLLLALWSGAWRLDQQDQIRFPCARSGNWACLCPGANGSRLVARSGRGKGAPAWNLDGPPKGAWLK